MKYLKLRNTLKFFFVIAIISVLISGCGKKESTEVSENTKKTESTSDMNNMNNMNNTDKKADDNINQDHIMIKVPTMQCGTCKKNIETAVKKLDGIESVDVDKKEKIAHINYDKTKLDQAKIELAITSAGYDANDKKADPEAYSKLDDCCKLPEDQKH